MSPGDLRLAERSPQYMEGLFTLDPLVTGVKGLVYIGNSIVLCRRDYNTDDHPGRLDMLGGGVESGETPFEAFRREVREEAGLSVQWGDVIYSRRYQGPREGRFSYFPVARVYERTANMRLGDEGLELVRMSLEEYVQRTDAIPFFQGRANEFLDLMNDIFKPRSTEVTRYTGVGRRVLSATTALC